MMRIQLLIGCFIVLFSMQVEGQQIEPYPDNSPHTLDFVAMGLSDVTKTWSVEEYEIAFALLDQVYEADKFSLPRKGSKYSGELFDRLISLENFNLVTDKGNRFQVSMK